MLIANCVQTMTKDVAPTFSARDVSKIKKFSRQKKVFIPFLPSRVVCGGGWGGVGWGREGQGGAGWGGVGQGGAGWGKVGRGGEGGRVDSQRKCKVVMVGALTLSNI